MMAIQTNPLYHGKRIVQVAQKLGYAELMYQLVKRSAVAKNSKNEQGTTQSEKGHLEMLKFLLPLLSVKNPKAETNR